MHTNLQFLTKSIIKQCKPFTGDAIIKSLSKIIWLPLKQRNRAIWFIFHLSCSELLKIKKWYCLNVAFYSSVLPIFIHYMKKEVLYMTDRWRWLTCFMSRIPFYTPWKHQKTSGFLMFSRGIERDQHYEMGWDLHNCISLKTESPSHIYSSK